MTAIARAANDSAPVVSRDLATPKGHSTGHDTGCGLRPFGFYGGKWRDSLKHYPLPVEDTIVEPFAGSAGYSIRFADRKVVLGEKDPIIHGVFHYLTHASAADILRIPDLNPGRRWQTYP